MRKQTISLWLSLFLVALFFIVFAANSAAGFSEDVGHASPNTVDKGQPVAHNTVADEAGWPMAGANPERTSWTPEEVRGSLKPLWFRPFEPYISQKVQIIAAHDTLYLSTARGLYALDADTGAERWVYATELPLGHSPTIHNGVAYVGSFDHRIHAIDALTGEGLWTFEAGAGFHTNPLVVDGIVYAGNRDGTFYAIHAEGSNAGQLAWQYKTGGPILFSAAYKDGTVFFASNDSHAYALDAQTGDLVWKSEKLPGAGFHSWWPVVYRDRVIFAGTNNYRTSTKPGGGAQMTELERDDIYPNHETDPRGTLVGPLGTEPGDWANGTPTIDASRIMDYFSEKPWRRTYLVLDRFTGQEQESAPVLWTGTHSGNRYPPVVGVDDVLYQQNNYMSDRYIAGGHISGWKIGTPFISIANDGWNAVDEPTAYSAGGNLIYWNRCCDRVTGAFDITIPAAPSSAARPTGDRSWAYYAYDLDDKLPGYNVRYHLSDTNSYASFDGPNGIYGYHGDTNAPIPYKGKVYVHRSNAIIAFGNSTGGEAVALPTVESVPAQDNVTPLGVDYLRDQLVAEIQKIVDAGHLRPAYISHGIFDQKGEHRCGDEVVDYWHYPGDTIYTLILALPHLPQDLQQEVKSYLQSEFTAYPPHEYNHIGWAGAPREIFDMPPDAYLADYLNPQTENYTFKNSGGWPRDGIWGRNPNLFYATWKYAEIFGDAQALFDDSKDRLEAPPSDEVLLNMPDVHNAFIAGYLGYLKLEALAGYPESTGVKAELNRLLTLRSNHFTKDSPYGDEGQGSKVSYCRTLNVARNFMFLVPEVAQYLRDNNLNQVQEAVDEYEELAPYWFVTKAEEGFAENAITLLYDSHSMFMAKSLILDEPAEELEKYLDIPAVARGDLFYIQKLVAAIESQSYGFNLSVTPKVQLIDSGESATYLVQVETIGDFDAPVSLNVTATPSDLLVDMSATTVDPPGEVTLTLTDTGNRNRIALSAGVWHTVTVTATGGGVTRNAKINLLVNGSHFYLTTIFKR